MKKIFLILIAIILSTISIFAIIDFQKVKKGGEPIFCFEQNKIRDGGTIEYIGFGYKIIDFHKIEGISSYYGEIHLVPIWIHRFQVYKTARGKEYALLGTMEKEYYNILAKFNNRKTLNKLVKEIQKYELKREIQYKSYKLNGKSMEINYKPGYGSFPFSDEEMEWFRLSLDAYYNESIDKSDKTLLKLFIKKNFSMVRSRTKDANIRDAIKELLED